MTEPFEPIRIRKGPRVRKCAKKCIVCLLAFSAVLVLHLTGGASYGICAQRQLKEEEAALDQVLRQMEEVGRGFVSFSAHLTRKKYTVVLKEFDIPESGEFFFARAKDGSALLRLEVNKPVHSILTISKGIATSFQPVIRQAQVFNLGKNKDKAEFLAIGIGQSPVKLRDTYAMAYLSTEAVDGSSCSMIMLKPKNPSAAAFFSAITLWIKKATGVPVRQKLQEPSGDYLLVDFTNEKLNAKIPASKFEQKLPSGTEIQRIQ